MKIWRKGFCVSLLIAVLVGQASRADTLPVRLAAVHSWSFALGLGSDEIAANLEKLRAFGLVVLDGEEASRGQIAQLKQEGVVVLGYLSIGTIERDRPWYQQVSDYRLDLWGDWDEWYARVAVEGYRRIMGRIGKRYLKKGFDGLFLDNVDMIGTHRRQARGMLQLVRELAEAAHARGKYVFTQNGEDTLGRFMPFLDGWNREDVTSTYNFEKERYEQVSTADHANAIAALEQIRAVGLLTLSTDYVARGDDDTAAAALTAACAAGALPYVSDIELTRLPAAPLLCR
jgi:polysaccharide biosynthesis protein PelA